MTVVFVWMQFRTLLILAASATSFAEEFNPGDIDNGQELYRGIDDGQAINRGLGTGGFGDCKNVRQDHECAIWQGLGHCDTAYMKSNCAFTCLHCDPSGDCKDEDPTCQRWKDEGHCALEYSLNFMTTYCALTCRFCQPSTCFDKHAECAQWKAQGRCTLESSNALWATHLKEVCPKSCKHCDDDHDRVDVELTTSPSMFPSTTSTAPISSAPTMVPTSSTKVPSMTPTTSNPTPNPTEPPTFKETTSSTSTSSSTTTEEQRTTVVPVSSAPTPMPTIESDPIALTSVPTFKETTTTTTSSSSSSSSTSTRTTSSTSTSSSTTTNEQTTASSSDGVPSNSTTTTSTQTQRMMDLFAATRFGKHCGGVGPNATSRMSPQFMIGDEDGTGYLVHDCFHACVAQKTECTAFVYNYADGMCQMFSKCQEPLMDDNLNWQTYLRKESEDPSSTIGTATISEIVNETNGGESGLTFGKSGLFGFQFTPTASPVPNPGITFEKKSSNNSLTSILSPAGLVTLIAAITFCVILLGLFIFSSVRSSALSKKVETLESTVSEQDYAAKVIPAPEVIRPFPKHSRNPLYTDSNVSSACTYDTPSEIMMNARFPSTSTEEEEEDSLSLAPKFIIDTDKANQMSQILEQGLFPDMNDDEAQWDDNMFSAGYNPPNISPKTNFRKKKAPGGASERTTQIYQLAKNKNPAHCDNDLKQAQSRSQLSVGGYPNPFEVDDTAWNRNSFKNSQDHMANSEDGIECDPDMVVDMSNEDDVVDMSNEDANLPTEPLLDEPVIEEMEVDMSNEDVTKTTDKGAVMDNEDTCSQTIEEDQSINMHEQRVQPAMLPILEEHPVIESCQVVNNEGNVANVNVTPSDSDGEISSPESTSPESTSPICDQPEDEGSNSPQPTSPIEDSINMTADPDSLMDNKNDLNENTGNDSNGIDSGYLNVNAVQPLTDNDDNDDNYNDDGDDNSNSNSNSTPRDLQAHPITESQPTVMVDGYQLPIASKTIDVAEVSPIKHIAPPTIDTATRSNSINNGNAIDANDDDDDNIEDNSSMLEESRSQLDAKMDTVSSSTTTSTTTTTTTTTSSSSSSSATPSETPTVVSEATTFVSSLGSRSLTSVAGVKLSTFEKDDNVQLVAIPEF